MGLMIRPGGKHRHENGRSGINSLLVAQTPVAVIDLETTVLVAGVDRVVEVSIVRVEPGGTRQVVLDTLVNPQRHMAATEIHGITDDDVRDAPRFRDIGGEVIDAIGDAVVAAYNVYFDIKFLDYELRRLGVRNAVPHFCLMYMRPMLGLGSRCKLEAACKAHDITYKSAHVAAEDARACGDLFWYYLSVLEQKGVRTFGELASLRQYKFTQSFSNPVLSATAFPGLRRSGKRLSRAGQAIVVLRDRGRLSLASYWDTLMAAVADLEITEDEFETVKEERKRLNLPQEQVRMLHARIFANAISQFTDDEWLDSAETQKLHRLHGCLSELGWAPGEL